MFKRNGDVMDRAFDNLEAMAGRLEADPDRPDQFVSGDPAWMYAALTEGNVESGIWTSEVGVWDEADYPVDEVMVVTKGHLRITNADGTVHDLTEGDIFALPKGWAGRWEVIEPMAKIYVIVP
ncbi:MAG: cupin domain-containing protein [Acidimicrobiia bacterium]|nr:cupin domain-containing protein [Acidimicrobiia bacterium]